MFREIILHDYSRPLAERAASRKHVGPYRWKPTEPGKGRGFYQAGGNGLECGDSTFRLRLVYANEFLRYSNLYNTDGYFCDQDCEGDTLQPIIARLPHGRGFLAGWTMGAGMCASLCPEIYADEEGAARAAHSIAEYDAESMAENSLADEEEDDSDDEI